MPCETQISVFISFGKKREFNHNVIFRDQAEHSKTPNCIPPSLWFKKFILMMMLSFRLLSPRPLREGAVSWIPWLNLVCKIMISPHSLALALLETNLWWRGRPAEWLALWGALVRKSIQEYSSYLTHMCYLRAEHIMMLVYSKMHSYEKKLSIMEGPLRPGLHHRISTLRRIIRDIFCSWGKLRFGDHKEIGVQT
jgi:hypothetical protein